MKQLLSVLLSPVMRILAASVFLMGTQALCQDPLIVDPGHYTVELENNWVRVLRVHYAPGEGSPMHEHTAGVRVLLTDIHSRFMNPDGSTSESSRSAGDVTWAEKVKHANRILSPSSVEIIELELKHLPLTPALPAPKTASPEAMETVIIENDIVRVLRADVPPGQGTAAHTHPNSVVIAWRRNSSKAPSGSLVSWLPEGPHTLRNSGRDALEAVIVELKERH